MEEFDRGIIVIICFSISLYLFRILLHIFLVLSLFLCFVVILKESGRKELEPGRNGENSKKQQIVKAVG